VKFDIYNGDSKVRFSLGQNGSRKLFIVGLNPSTADAEQSDQTIRKVIGFMERQKRFDGFVMLDLCPLRSTNPNSLPKLEDEELRHFAERNSEVIQEIFEGENTPTIWAAWGNSIKMRPYFFEYLKVIVNAATKRKGDWKKCGHLTKRGHPRHPSRLGYAVECGRFDVKEYLCAFAPLR
jgi:hypothetical protein